MTLSLSVATFHRQNSFYAIYSLQNHMHTLSQEALRTEGSCSDETSLTGLQINMKHACTQKYFRCLRNLCLVFPAQVFPNPKPGSLSYFLLPETQFFSNHQIQIFKKTWNCCCI